MEESKVTFETAKLAKEKRFELKALQIGFDYYKPNGEKLMLGEYSSEFVKFCTPYCTQSLLQKWLREVHNIHIDIPYMDEVLMFGYKITTMNNNTEVIEIYKYNSYEEALEIGLQEALKLIPNK